MKKHRQGIVRISTHLLAQWMQLPPGMSIVALASPKPGEFSVLLEGPDLPETDENQMPPGVVMTIYAPRVEFDVDTKNPPADGHTTSTFRPQRACPVCLGVGAIWQIPHTPHPSLFDLTNGVKPVRTTCPACAGIAAEPTAPPHPTYLR